MTRYEYPRQSVGCPLDLPDGTKDNLEQAANEEIDDCENIANTYNCLNGGSTPTRDGSERDWG